MRQENSIKLSIIIPVFNERNFLQRLFEQVKEFNKSNTEVIFVDDGSTDGSTEIIKKIIEQESYNFSLRHIKLHINS